MPQMGLLSTLMPHPPVLISVSCPAEFCSHWQGRLCQPHQRVRGGARDGSRGHAEAAGVWRCRGQRLPAAAHVGALVESFPPPLLDWLFNIMACRAQWLR